MEEINRIPVWSRSAEYSSLQEADVEAAARRIPAQGQQRQHPSGESLHECKSSRAENNWAGSTDPQCSSLKHWLIYILQMRKLRREKKRNQTEFQLVGDREVKSISGVNAISYCSTLASLEQQSDEEICFRFRLNPNWDISHHINIHCQLASHFPACTFFFLVRPLVQFVFCGPHGF